MGENAEVKFLNRVSLMIDDAKSGLDPDVLAIWYKKIVDRAQTICPEELSDTIEVIQDPDLIMKFELKSSKRVVPHIIDAIESNLELMPFATRLYFLKVGELLQQEYFAFIKSSGLRSSKEISINESESS